MKNPDVKEIASVFSRLFDSVVVVRDTADRGNRHGFASDPKLAVVSEP